MGIVGRYAVSPGFSPGRPIRPVRSGWPPRAGQGGEEGDVADSGIRLDFPPRPPAIEPLAVVKIEVSPVADIEHLHFLEWLCRVRPSF